MAWGAYDVIVVGVGLRGSAAVAFPTLRDIGVLGLKQYDTLHDRGSSHATGGRTHYAIVLFNAARFNQEVRA